MGVKCTLANHVIQRELMAIHDHHIVRPFETIPIHSGNPWTTSKIFVDLIFMIQIGVGFLVMLKFQSNFFFFLNVLPEIYTSCCKVR